MKKYFLTVLVFILLFSCLTPPTISHSVTVKTESDLINVGNTISNKTEVTMETVAFDENEFLPITTFNEALIGYYKRKENPNFGINGADVFNNNKELTYTIMPLVDQSGIQIFIKSSDEKKGHIIINQSAKVKPGSVTINYNNDVSLFNNPINFNINHEDIMKMNYSSNDHKRTTEFIFYYDDEIMLGKVTKGSINTNFQTEIFVNEKYIESNSDLISCLIVSLEILEDVNKSFKSNNSSLNHTQFNHNGSIDNNFNPADNF